MRIIRNVTSIDLEDSMQAGGALPLRALALIRARANTLRHTSAADAAARPLGPVCATLRMQPVPKLLRVDFFGARSEG